MQAPAMVLFPKMIIVTDGFEERGRISFVRTLPGVVPRLRRMCIQWIGDVNYLGGLLNTISGLGHN